MMKQQVEIMKLFMNVTEEKTNGVHENTPD